MIGTHPLPSSFMIDEIMLLQQGPGNDGVRSWRARYFARDWFPRPVDPHRWPLVRPAALARAQDEGRSLEDVMVDATLTAMALVNVEGIETSPERSFEQGVREFINNAVTEDFLGPEWRHRLAAEGPDGPRETEWTEGDREGDRPDGSAALDAILVDHDVRALMARAGLSPREEAVLVAVYVEGRQTAAWAREQGIAESGARTLLMRARGKLKRAAGQ